MPRLNRPIPPNAITDFSAPPDHKHEKTPGRPPKYKRLYEVVDTMLSVQCAVVPVPEEWEQNPSGFVKSLRVGLLGHCKPRSGYRHSIWVAEKGGADVVVVQWVATEDRATRQELYEKYGRDNPVPTRTSFRGT